ncbi:aldose 1-epimerase family protein [Huintestinicola sp.]|uniref:aldose 1-epimerase family protein n=1 Tax=Huintestinicola sp. TaxID=2981661 RepID=UPI003D7CF166
MQYTIKSDKLTAVIDRFGGELHSLKDTMGNEYIWTAEDVWKRHAPLLFPFVCNTKSKKYTVNGKEYSLSNHGFARDTEFSDKSVQGDRVTLSICSDEGTKAKYPFDFEFSVTYALSGNKLSVTMEAKNTGDGDMPFFVGGHPGFLCPFEADKDSTFEDYDVVYEKNETITQDEFGVTVLDNANKVGVTRELFKNDVFMKDKPASSKVSLVSRKSGKSVTVSYDNSGCIAVWSPYDDRGHFVCLEPWASAPVYCCDTEELTEMPHAKHIAPGENYSFSFDIEIK